MPIIRIAGLMRSGTNLTTWMLRNNFESVQTATMLLGWKHGPIFRDKQTLSIDDFLDPRYSENLWAFVRERPQEWLRVTESALFKEVAEAQKRGTFAVALSVQHPRLWYASCLRVHSQNPGFLNHGVAPGEAAAKWNESHKQWFKNMGNRGVIVNAEALRIDPEPVLEEIALNLRLSRKAELRVPEGYLSLVDQEELLELLGMPKRDSPSARKITKGDSLDERLYEEFVGHLDHALVNELGLKLFD
jgi:hypothetical protein